MTWGAPLRSGAERSSGHEGGEAAAGQPRGLHAWGQQPIAADAEARLPVPERAGRVGGQFWSVYIEGTTLGDEAIRHTIEQIDTARRIIDAATVASGVAVETAQAAAAEVLAEAEPAAAPKGTAREDEASADPDAERLAQVKAWIKLRTRPRPPLNV